jgi:hypothetical protein
MATKTYASMPSYTRNDSIAERPASVNKRNGLEGKQRETAQYIADMILELRNLAKSAKLFHVMAPLEFAYYESYSAANRIEPPAGEVEHLRQLSKIVEKLEKISEDVKD